MQRGLLFVALAIVLAIVGWSMFGVSSHPAASSPNPVPVTETQEVLGPTIDDPLRGIWRLVEYNRNGKRHRLAVDNAQSPDVGFCTLEVQADSARLSASPRFHLAEVSAPLTWSVRSTSDENVCQLQAVEPSSETRSDLLNVSAALIEERLRLSSDDGQIDWLFEPQRDQQTTVFLVHGTYDATSDWVREVPETVTFASEIRRALGTEKVRIEPFLWRTSVQHAVRNEAAANLAALLDEPRFAADRVVLIGHSHGGNVCLSAASRCQRRVDVVACLATPHMHVLMQDERQEPAALPVYLTPKGRANIGIIVNLWVQTDPVVAQRVNAFLGPWAAVRAGLEEQTAIHAVHDWRREQNYPRLIHEDGPIKELMDDYVGTKRKSHLTTLSRLAIADYEFELACEIKDTQAHSVIHSCRVGRVLGAAIRDGFSEEMMDYLSGLWLAANSDTGGPITFAAAEEWWQTHRGGVHFNGWLLKSLELNCTSQNRPNGVAWDSDGSWPDIYVSGKVGPDGNKVSSSVCEGSPLRWQPWLRFPPDTVVPFEIRDRDPVSSDELMGQFQIPAETDARSPFIDTTDAYSLRVEWIPLHD